MSVSDEVKDYKELLTIITFIVTLVVIYSLWKYSFSVEIVNVIEPLNIKPIEREIPLNIDAINKLPTNEVFEQTKTSFNVEKAVKIFSYVIMIYVVYRILTR